MFVDIAVLGGGWAGSLYGLEYKLLNSSDNVAILEKKKSVGGLLKSEVVDGHVFDTGGSHIIFSKNKVILNKMLKFLAGNTHKLTRKSFILFSHQFIPYPFENNLNALSQKDRINAIISFLESWHTRSDNFIPRNLSEWIYSNFGKWIAEKYLAPYNLKLWKRELDEIDVDWLYMLGRLPVPNWIDIVKSAMGQPTPGYIEQSEFYYPKNGGIQRLFNAVMEKAIKLGVNYVKGYKIMNIKKIKNGWLINKKIYAKNLVSSIPLNELVKLMEAPEHIIKLSNDLDYNRVLVVGLAVNKSAPKQHWVYIPTPDVIFNRYAWISNYSPFNAPPNKSTLIAEITIPPNKPFKAEKYIEETLEGLEKLGVIKNREILFTRYWLHEYGYPVHTLKSNKARAEITQWIREQNVALIGRWGCWQYWNMDKVYQEVLNDIGERYRKGSRKASLNVPHP